MRYLIKIGLSLFILALFNCTIFKDKYTLITRYYLDTLIIYEAKITTVNKYVDDVHYGINILDPQLEGKNHVLKVYRGGYDVPLKNGELISVVIFDDIIYPANFNGLGGILIIISNIVMISAITYLIRFLKKNPR